MLRFRSPHVLGAALALALAIAAALTTPARAQPAQAVCDDVRPTPSFPGAARAAALSESLFLATQVPRMEQVLVEAIAAARASGDRKATLWFLRRTGELRARHGRALEAEPALREAEALALEFGDSLSLASVLRWESFIQSQRGDFAASRRTAERMGLIARRTGDRLHAGWAESVGAWMDVQDGRMSEAVTRFRRAAAAFRALGNTKDEVFVLGGMGAALRGAGRFEEARATLVRTIAATESTIYRRAYGHALVNLANLDQDLGDPAGAVESYARAYELFRSRQVWNELADPLLGLALAHADLGRYAAARAALDSIYAVTQLSGFRDQLGVERVTRARVALAEGKPREAMRLLDQAVAMGDTLNVDTRMGLASARAIALERLGRPADAAAVLAAARRTFGSLAPYDARVDFDLRLAAFACDRGDMRGARERARPLAVASARAGLLELAMGGWLVVARAERALGDPRAALAALDSARVAWESLRGRPSASEWRERRGALARDLIVETVDLLLAAGPGERAMRTRAAFEALQRYKARTLLERVAGPRGGEQAAAALAPATLARVQAALHDGEVLLDYLVGAGRATVFAVTRNGARADTIPAAAGLEARAALYRDLLANRQTNQGAANEVARRAAARRLGADLLAPAAAELAGARRVLVSPDGQLHRIPFATLEFAEGEGEPSPLLERAAVATVPSASLLLAVRSAAPAPDGVVLAVADSLPGANAEARAVSRDLAGARFVRVDRRHALAVDDFDHCAALHFAGHSEADDASPWRSPLPFLRLANGREATASDLAALRIPTRLAVLSSCQTVGGSVLNGEGMLGLSSAFLAAGVPTVVASLWRVDDRVTRELMAAFYASLLAGADPATALQKAQLAVRGRPESRHPFYWAGFVVIGDGAAAAGLRANPFSPIRLSGYAAGILALAAAVALVQRSRRRKAAPFRL